MENTYIESFNGKFREECLNTNPFISLKHAWEVRGQAAKLVKGSDA